MGNVREMSGRKKQMAIVALKLRVDVAQGVLKTDAKI